MQIDWLTDATIEALRDKGKIRGAHYSWYISEQEATELASKAIADNEPWYDYADNFCDREHLYGTARWDARGKIMVVHDMLRQLMDTTEWPTSK